MRGPTKNRGPARLSKAEKARLEAKRERDRLYRKKKRAEENRASREQAQKLEAKRERDRLYRQKKRAEEKEAARLLAEKAERARQAKLERDRARQAALRAAAKAATEKKKKESFEKKAGRARRVLRHVHEWAERLGHNVTSFHAKNADGTFDAVARITTWRTGWFEEQFRDLTTEWNYMPRALSPGTRLRLSLRMEDTKKTAKYLSRSGGLPSIRTKYWTRKEIPGGLVATQTTAQTIDEEKWTVQVLVVHLRIDPKWVAKG